MPRRIDEAGHTKAFDYPVAEHWGESQRTERSLVPLPTSENNLIVAHNIIDLLDLFMFFFEHGSQHLGLFYRMSLYVGL